MAKKKTAVGEPERIFDWSGGMNNAVNPALLNDNESVLLQNYTLDEKGTLFPAKGVANRYASAFGTSPVAGMGPFYKSDGTTRLLIGTEDGKLYVDTPHLVNSYDTQGEFNNGKYQATVATPDGKVWPMIVSTGFEDGYFTDFHTKDSGWTIDTTVYKTGAKSAKGTGTTQKLIRELGFNASQVYVKLACRFAETNQQHFPVILLSPTGTQIQAIVADSDGNFKYHNGTALTAFPTAKTYAANTWYVVEVWVRGGTFWVSIDSVSLTPSGLTMKDTANAAQTQVAKVQIQNAGATSATMWVDDVEVNALAAVVSRSSVAYTSTGTQVAANVPRYEAGKYGQAVMVEEETTNIAHDPNTDNAWWNAAPNWGFTWGLSNDWDATEQALKIRSYSSSHSGHSFYLDIQRDVYFTIRAKIKNVQNALYGSFRLVLFDATGALVVANYVPDILAQSNWTGHNTSDYQEAWITYRIPSGVYLSATKYTIQLLGSGSVESVIYMKNIQLEQKSYPTSWYDYNSTRSPETLTIPTAGVLNPQEGTVECWFYYKPNGIYQRIVSFLGSALNGYRDLQFDITNTGYVRFQPKRLADSTEAVSILSASPITEGWHYAVCTWDQSEIKVAVDDQPIRKLSYGGGIATLDAYFTVGKEHGATSAYLNSLIDDLRISSRARTDAEISAAYTSGVALPVDADTTYKLALDGSLNVEAAYTWISPVIDASNATNKASGHAALTADTPGGSTISIQSRSAPASTGPWTAWVNALADGTLQHTADNFVQVRLILTRSGEDDPDVDKLVVSFDGQASVTLLASDFTAGGQFFYGQLTDYLAVANGLDAPRKYDGATLALIGGSPPHASYVTAHKNRLWLAKGSRLYFSDLLNIDSWPVLNFIDIMPNDGDTITGLLTYGDYLIISKQHSMWMLTGEGINTFQVRRIHADKGAYAPRSLCIVNQMLCFISDDGIYFSDFTQPVLASERMRQTWAGLNKRRLNLVASWFTEHKLYVAVPNGTSQRNNLVIVYDALRQAFAGVFTGWNVSCWTDFREAGEINSYFGCSDTGQVKRINTGYNNAGQAYTADYKSKEFSFGVPEIFKRWNKVYLQVKPAALAATLTISFIVDGKETGTMTVNVPADTDGLIHTLLVLASKVGVVGGHRLGIRIQQQVLDNPVGIQTVYIESVPTLVKPTIWG